MYKRVTQEIGFLKFVTNVKSQSPLTGWNDIWGRSVLSSIYLTYLIRHREKVTANIQGRKGSVKEVERDWECWGNVKERGGKKEEGHKTDESHEYRSAEMWENFTAAIVCHSLCMCVYVITISSMMCLALNWSNYPTQICFCIPYSFTQSVLHRYTVSPFQTHRQQTHPLSLLSLAARPCPCQKMTSLYTTSKNLFSYLLQDNDSNSTSDTKLIMFLIISCFDASLVFLCIFVKC